MCSIYIGYIYVCALVYCVYICIHSFMPDYILPIDKLTCFDKASLCFA